MILILRDSWGGTAEAAVLAIDGDTMRVAICGHDDALELTSVAGTWFGEDGRRFSIEAALTEPQAGGRQMKMKYTATAASARTAANASISMACGRDIN